MRDSRFRARVALATVLWVVPVFAPTLAGAHEGPHDADATEGVTVQSVVGGSSAEAAGVLAGDRFVEIDGKSVDTEPELRGVLGSYRPGDTVALRVERDGEELELSLTFGGDREGIASMGVSLAVAGGAGHRAARDGDSTGAARAGLGREECLTWVDETYRVETLLVELGLDLGQDWKTARVCTAGDVQQMSEPIPVGWCDNVFKIHCSGLDLLTEIGEAQIERCEELLSESLGRPVDQDPSWRTCGAQTVFDRYSMSGESSDAATCQAALDGCRDTQ